MLITAKPVANSATTTRTQGVTVTMEKTENSPAMNSAYTSAVTKMYTNPITAMVRRDPVRNVRASSIDGTHNEQGLNPSTAAMSAVVTARECVPTSTSPMSGSEITSVCVGGGVGSGAPDGPGSKTPAPASGHPVDRHRAIAESS